MPTQHSLPDCGSQSCVLQLTWFQRTVGTGALAGGVPPASRFEPPVAATEAGTTGSREGR